MNFVCKMYSVFVLFGLFLVHVVSAIFSCDLYTIIFLFSLTLYFILFSMIHLLCVNFTQMSKVCYF